MMRGLIRRLVPSMFHRRLLLLAAGMLAVALILLTQMARLTLVEGSAWRARAEAVLVRHQVIPTSRGKIFDRKGRPLAVDQATYHLSVAFPVMTGQWAYRQARLSAFREHREEWSQLSAEQRHALALGHLPHFEEEVSELWREIAGWSEESTDELEQRLAVIVRRVNRMAGSVWSRRKIDRAEDLESEVDLVDVAQPIHEQVSEHVIVEDLSPRARIEVQKRIAQADADPALAIWKQVSLAPARRRQYPQATIRVDLAPDSFPSAVRDSLAAKADDQTGTVPWETRGVGLHLIGTMRPVWREDLVGRPYRRWESGRPIIDAGGYRDGDKTGNWGVERSQEKVLRGVRGHVLKRIDTGAEQRVEPTKGGNVRLSIDIVLQARVQAAMDPQAGLMKVQPWHARKPPDDPLQPQLGDALYGAAVVLEVETGQVLAAVSTPGFSAEQMRDDPDAIWEDRINRPYINRVIAQPYQPGSTIKPIVLAAAVTEGRFADGQHITCNGHLDPQAPQRYRCWIYKTYNSTHGPLPAPEAIARSCNVFFYTMGRRLGPQRLTSWFNKFGLGRVSGTGLIEEAVGDLPDLSPGGDRLLESDGIFMAIGQGPVRWTPLQAVNAYAALARGGRAKPAVLVMDLPTNEIADTGSTEMKLHPAGVRLAMQGLYDAANEDHGTAHHLSMLNREPIFNIDGVRISGKSGTAQGVPLWVDEDNDQRFTPGRDRVVRRGDHAWTVCMAQKAGENKPEYVVVVVVEFGGSGGSVAGPVVNQVLHALRAEGYL